MEDLIKLLVEPLVENPDEIKVEKHQDGNNITFNLIVPQKDIAKVIGKEGRMVKAIKNLLKIRAIKENVFVNLEVTEA